MLYIFGDPHINDSKPWFIKASNAFIEWLDKQEFNNDSNEILFLGDMTESFINTGNVMAMLHNLFTICRFRKVYILVGNHDLKKHQVSGEHLTYEFIKNYDSSKFIILSEPAQVLDIHGLKTLSLPYFSITPEGLTMTKYYENLPASIIAQEYDLVVGHILDDSVATRITPIKIHNKIKSKHFAYGHIHNRIGPKYLGSLFPVKSNENGDRYYKCIDSNGAKDYKLPSFCEYVEVEYPNSLPVSTASAVVYSIYNCPSLDTAKKFYGYDNFYHKTYPYSKTYFHEMFKNKDVVIRADQNDFNILNNKKLTLPMILSSYMKDNPDLRISRDLYQLVMRLPS